MNSIDPQLAEWAKARNIPADALHGPTGAIIATVGDNGRCDFGEGVSAMTYDPRLGIFAERPIKTTPQRKDDDDDEFDS